MVDSNEEDAIAWAVRVSDPEFSDWESFKAWLIGDPARGLAYANATAGIDDAVVAVTASHYTAASLGIPAAIVPRRINDARPRQLSVRRWLPAVGLVLAAGVAYISVINWPSADLQRQTVETAMGQRLRVTLADGSRVEIAGGSQLILDRNRPREMALARGRAIFSVFHDAATPFQVVAGPVRVIDVGTVFEIVRTDDATDVAVAEGSVVVHSDKQSVSLSAGTGAFLLDGAVARLTSRLSTAIGQWRRDRMSYRDAPLTQVAADLSAALCRPVTIGSGLEGRRITGSLAIDAVRNHPQDLAALLDVRVSSTDKGWELESR